MAKLTASELADFRNMLRRIVENNQLSFTGTAGGSIISVDKIKIVDDGIREFVEVELRKPYYSDWDR